ncbi:hypothetical protein [Paracoccus sp. JM45]|uniref:hypothetical protein n=1 Tax=Paracoccus sp. JM45 TaxID=2283626 RepID=UPI000E6C6FA5|nr:hypothetical protein [Paracoccus sp. JM45]RJE79850.1 hypothetical protein DWB67_10710 [Paracoccus sp. JM45]
MKTIILTALTALSLTAGIAGAATSKGNERPDAFTAAVAEQTTQVRADSVLTTVELSRANIDADTIVTITAFPTDTRVAKNNQDR